MRTPNSRPSPDGAPASVVVRELRWSDYPALREGYYLLYEERESRPEIGITLFASRPTEADEVAWFSGLYRKALSGESVVVVAERDGTAIGNCTVSPIGTPSTSETAHVGELGILVHRDHRGQGVGRALLENALGQCRAKFDLVRLWVFSTNSRARRLYEEFGFVYVGTLPRAVRRGDRYFDEDLMFLDFGRANANR